MNNAHPSRIGKSAPVPWDGWDLALALCYFSLAAVLLLTGLRDFSAVLELSGLEVFGSKLCSIVLVGLATLLHTTWSHARTNSIRRYTEWSISIAGLAAVLCWILLFSGVLSGGAYRGPLLLRLGILAEVLISAACWIQGSALMEKRRPIREAPNPKAVAIDERMDRRKPQFGLRTDLSITGSTPDGRDAATPNNPNSEETSE